MKRTMPVAHPVQLNRWIVLCLGACVAAPWGKAFVFERGDFTATLDSTLSAGAIYRLHQPDRQYYGTSNGGLQNSVNADDGDLNYPQGFASEVVKGTHDLEMKWRNFGAFVRGTYFYDFVNEDKDRPHIPLTSWAKDRVGSDAELLDMYVRGTFEVADRPLEIRFGRQVLNLGESTFIPNGINVINPVDVSKLRIPGSELREALLPVNMLKASYGLTKDLTVDAFWLLEFRRTEIDPSGTYFSTNDFASRGGSNVYLGFGALSDLQPLGAVGRDHDREGGNYNQYGADLHYTAHGLGKAEFGLYFANYHSRLPVISARTPTAGIDPNLTLPLTQALIRGGFASDVAAAQAAGIYSLIVLSQTNPAALTATQLATLQAPQTQAAINGAKQIALLTAAANGRYFVEYPENIKMIGASFNADLGTTGIAWQGEVSYKHGVPLQVDDVELLFATLSALSPAFGPPNNQLGNYLGDYGQEVSGYRRKDVWTGQTTLTKIFGPMLGASQLTLVGEVGGVYVPALPNKDVLRFDAPGTFTSGSQAAMNATTSPGSVPLPNTSLNMFPDPFSWGYQVVGRLDYNNVFAGVNFSPSLAFVHDVSGTTPLPLGNFVSGRKSINLVAEFSLKNAWSIELRYVNFFGGGPSNLLSDRDYVSTTLKYSF